MKNHRHAMDEYRQQGKKKKSANNESKVNPYKPHVMYQSMGLYEGGRNQTDTLWNWKRNKQNSHTMHSETKNRAHYAK